MTEQMPESVRQHQMVPDVSAETIEATFGAALEDPEFPVRCATCGSTDPDTPCATEGM